MHLFARLYTAAMINITQATALVIAPETTNGFRLCISEGVDVAVLASEVLPRNKWGVVGA